MAPLQAFRMPPLPSSATPRQPSRRRRPWPTSALAAVLSVAGLGLLPVAGLAASAPQAQAATSATATPAPVTKASPVRAAPGRRAAVKVVAPAKPQVSSAAVKPAAILGTPYLPTGTAAYWAYRNETDPALKRTWFQIGATPSALWFDGVGADSDTRLRNLVTRADAAGKVAQFVIYGIPGRDCGSLSAGGQKDAASYRAWIDRVSTIVGSSQVVVIVEPDAISYCGANKKKAEWAPLLSYVGSTFKARNPNAALYLHAGSSQLGQADAANAVIPAGIADMRGFAMNVASHQTTAANEAWAEKFVDTLAARGVKDMHYVVDTSRNGLGMQANSADAAFTSCNNFNAAVGTRPTSNTTGAHADAYLWTKPVGESDGRCRPGDPATGTWYPQLAKAQVDNAVKHGVIENLPLSNV